ncbi:MAG TPA: hypothetical protein VFM25_07695, partial [Verrucomicrobiae bacterium]|nr:hypothetical protein [Verrucomicrobiae bacterium]
TTWTLGHPNNGLETQAHSPENAWGSNLNGDVIGLGDTTLAGPAIDLTGGDRATLRFWQSYDFSSQSDSDIYESGEVDVSTNNGNAWIPLAEVDDSSDGWEEAEYDLTPYVGHVIRIGFYYGFFTLEDAVHPGWLLDDISVTTTNSGAKPFQFQSLAFTNGQAQLTFSVPSGISYMIEGSTNLVDWSPIETNSGAGANSVFVDLQSTNFPRRFYRLKR